MSLSLMNCQMIRGISSPLSSTTGFVTLIFAIYLATSVRAREILGDRARRAPANGADALERAFLQQRRQRLVISNQARGIACLSGAGAMQAMQIAGRVFSLSPLAGRGSG